MLPGFGLGQTSTVDGQSLSTPGGGGEDEELSVARILWSLEANPAVNRNDLWVFSEAVAGNGTLASLWTRLNTDLPDAGHALAGIFAAENVAPALQGAVYDATDATFTFWLPITGDPSNAATQAAYPPGTAPLTFTSVTLNVFDYGGSKVLTQEFQLSDVASLPTQEQQQPGGLIVDETDPATPTCGAKVEVSWTVPQAEWAALAGTLGIGSWSVIGTTPTVGLNPLSTFPSVQMPLDLSARA